MPIGSISGYDLRSEIGPTGILGPVGRDRAMRFSSGLAFIADAIRDVGEAVKVASDQKDLTMGDRTKRGKVTDNGDDE